ncbi:hypothetical protein ANCCEY_04099 [Ancylostoma ceylanicum]|uniref:Ion transport domain-containing protein n=1 Tax=Ancylostoma ceylanicum TaxID=53326 RepID=A0A0D6MA68_9BILA|nr:hypothetical protein ANCCEY_04099 [Ancylostoma ceylanicum]
MGEAKYFDGSRVLKRAYTRPRHAETCWGGCCRVRNPWSIRSEETSIELMAVAYRAKAMNLDELEDRNGQKSFVGSSRLEISRFALLSIFMEKYTVKTDSLIHKTKSDFLAHNCCQSLIERRWHGRLRLSPNGAFEIFGEVDDEDKTRTLISYLFPCFIYKEFALRKARGPEVIRATRIEESALSSHPTGKPNDEYKEKLLVRASKDPGFANTVDLDSPLIIAPDASTPTSVELKQLHNVVVSELPSAAANASKHVMKCAAPRFPVKEEDRSIVHHSTEPSPLVIERIAQSVVFPVREEQGRDESPIYDRFDDLPEYSGIIPLWLWSTLKFYGTTKAKFFYHVIFRILYVIVYAWVLVAKPRRRSTIPRISNYWPELFVALVQLSQLCDSMAAIRQRMPPATRIPGPWICNVLERYGRKLGRIRLGFFEWTSEHLFGFYRNMIIIVNCILISTLLIHEGLAQGEIVSVLSYKFDRTDFHAKKNEEYAVRSNHSLAWMMFQNGAFEIFGEVDDEDKVGSVTGCGDITWESIWTANISDLRCLFRSTLIPITVFTYMLVASILLVNLLTALLSWVLTWFRACKSCNVMARQPGSLKQHLYSKEYDEVSGAGSAVYWKYDNYFLLATYESKLWLPPPLSLSYYLLHAVVLLARTITCVACRPWGTLKQVRKHHRDQFDLNEVRKLVSRRNKSEFHVRVRDLVGIKFN